MLQLVVVHKVAVILGSRHCCLVLAFLVFSASSAIVLRKPFYYSDHSISILLKLSIVVVGSCLWAAIKNLLGIVCFPCKKNVIRFQCGADFPYTYKNCEVFMQNLCSP